jgi:hypothetical protein
MLLLLTLLLTSAADDERPEIAQGMPLLVSEDFNDESLPGWSFTDRTAWRVAEAPVGRILEQHKASDYTPAVRSPFNIAWLDSPRLADFVLDVQVRSTAREYGHRDACLFFGRQDDSHFYYVHLAPAPDPAAHSIFLVDGQPRVSIATERSEGVAWGDGWHHLRLVRKTSTGLIEVYFDNMRTPILRAADRTFPAGPIGLGTFDDTAQFDHLRVWGITAP